MRPVDNSNTDCADGSALAYPGNGLGYQSKVIPNTNSYDWNCDGVETHQFGNNGFGSSQEFVSKTSSCTYIGPPTVPTGSCNGSYGWTGAYPDCGDAAEYTSCTSWNASTNPSCAGSPRTNVVNKTELCR